MRIKFCKDVIKQPNAYYAGVESVVIAVIFVAK